MYRVVRGRGSRDEGKMEKKERGVEKEWWWWRGDYVYPKRVSAIELYGKQGMSYWSGA